MVNYDGLYSEDAVITRKQFCEIWAKHHKDAAREILQELKTGRSESKSKRFENLQAVRTELCLVNTFEGLIDSRSYCKPYINPMPFRE